MKDRQTREPHTAAAEHICAKLKKQVGRMFWETLGLLLVVFKAFHAFHLSLLQDKILLQSDGPYNNVLKFKSPMVFSEENAKQLLNALDETLAEITKS